MVDRPSIHCIPESLPAVLQKEEEDGNAHNNTLSFCLSLIENSGGAVPCLGSASLHNGPEGPVRVQREPVHFNGHLQRVPANLLPQRFHVSGPAEGGGSGINR